MRLILAALLLMLLTPASAHGSCATMQALAQEHANDMARRGSMDHNGFASRARRGARAENVAYGVKGANEAGRPNSNRCPAMAFPACPVTLCLGYGELEVQVAVRAGVIGPLRLTGLRRLIC